MSVVAGGKSALTKVQMIRVDGARTLAAVQLMTGRTHQIRVHLSSVGHPVVGDRFYGDAGSIETLQLHAALISFEHPKEMRRITLYQPPPQDFIISDVTRSDLEDWE